MRHRRMQLLAAMEAAHEHDERAEIERQLRDVDAAIVGRTAPGEKEVEELERKLGGPIRRRAARR